MTNKTPKAIFLDRDGTLIRDKNYLSRVEDIEYFPDTFAALKIMQAHGYRLYVITNQSGVGRGFFPLESVHAVHAAMDADMTIHKLEPYQGWGICPHSPDEACSCRKPGPQMIQEFLQRDGLDPKLCWMLGDKEIDAACGMNAGIQGAVVREKSAAGKHTFFATLLDFAKSLG
jgi:D-glycero-D-manno-heptose 1,7-bisphosphate phosphatase